MGTENVFQDGPYLSAALLCEYLLEEKDAAKTVVRIHDRVIQTAVGAAVPEKMPIISASPTLFLSFKIGKRRGKHEIRIELTKPDGDKAPSHKLTVNLEGTDNQGIDLRIHLQLAIDQEGVYWIDVYFDELRFTRVPLQVVYLIQTTGTSSPAPVM